MEAADAVWPLASESEGLLERLSHDILRANRILLGSAPGAVRVAASKLKVARALADGGVPVAATYSPHACLPDVATAHGWSSPTTAPAASTSACSATARRRWRGSAPRGGRLCAAAFVAGKLGSLSLLCCDGVARVLSAQPGTGGHAQ
jgi:predicted ATP-grasp superfamily ATP-dependent carboligase